MTLRVGSLEEGAASLDHEATWLLGHTRQITFGRLWEGEMMRVVVADEISPDSCRLWDIQTKDKLDKDRFRRDMGGLVEAYQEVARRLGILPEGGPGDAPGTKAIQ